MKEILQKVEKGDTFVYTSLHKSLKMCAMKKITSSPSHNCFYITRALLIEKSYMSYIPKTMNKIYSTPKAINTINPHNKYY